MAPSFGLFSLCLTTITIAQHTVINGDTTYINNDDNATGWNIESDADFPFTTQHDANFRGGTYFIGPYNGINSITNETTIISQQFACDQGSSVNVRYYSFHCGTYEHDDDVQLYLNNIPQSNTFFHGKYNASNMDGNISNSSSLHSYCPMPWYYKMWRFETNGIAAVHANIPFNVSFVIHLSLPNEWVSIGLVRVRCTTLTNSPTTPWPTASVTETIYSSPPNTADSATTSSTSSMFVSEQLTLTTATPSTADNEQQSLVDILMNSPPELIMLVVLILSILTCCIILFLIYWMKRTKKSLIRDLAKVKSISMSPKASQSVPSPNRDSMREFTLRTNTPKDLSESVIMSNPTHFQSEGFELTKSPIASINKSSDPFQRQFPSSPVSPPYVQGQPFHHYPMSFTGDSNHSLSPIYGFASNQLGLAPGHQLSGSYQLTPPPPVQLVYACPSNSTVFTQNRAHPILQQRSSAISELSKVSLTVSATKEATEEDQDISPSNDSHSSEDLDDSNDSADSLDSQDSSGSSLSTSSSSTMSTESDDEETTATQSMTSFKRPSHERLVTMMVLPSKRNNSIYDSQDLKEVDEEDLSDDLDSMEEDVDDDDDKKEDEEEEEEETEELTQSTVLIAPLPYQPSLSDLSTEQDSEEYTESSAAWTDRSRRTLSVSGAGTVGGSMRTMFNLQPIVETMLEDEDEDEDETVDLDEDGSFSEI